MKVSSGSMMMCMRGMMMHSTLFVVLLSRF